MSAVLIAALAGLSLMQAEPAATTPPSNASRLQDMLNAMRDDTPEPDAEREARLQADAQAYIAEVEAALQTVRRYAPATRTGDEADILAVLDQFDAWAELYAALADRPRGDRRPAAGYALQRPERCVRRDPVHQSGFPAGE